MRTREIDILTPEQKAHFHIFGFLLLHGLFSNNEMDALTSEADSILSEDRNGKPFLGEKRQAVLAFVERRPLLANLVTDDRIYQPIKDLLGSGFMWVGSDGNLYVSDTSWHSDSRADPREQGYTRIKVAMYLESVSKKTGCLRVIPGSHLSPLHEELEPMRNLRLMQSDYSGKTKSVQDIAKRGGEYTPNSEPFGVPPSEMPGFSLELQPGDVVLFNQRLWHSSFGGRTGRRMFTLNFGQKPTADEHIDLIKVVYEASLASAQKMQHTWTNQLYSDRFLTSTEPRIKSMMAVPLELGLR